MWNVLLANAFDDLRIKRKFQIGLTDLAEVLEYHSKDWEHFRKALRGLMQTIVEWDVFGKCRKIEWHASTLLASVEIVDGIVTYSYSEFLREQFHHPTMFAKISLRLQNKFQSKHSQCLWELACDIFDQSRGEGETRWLSLEEYRKFMGIAPGKYPDFKRFNYRAVKEPVAEINALTDFVVSMEQKSQGRRVTALKVKVERKDQRPDVKVARKTPSHIPAHSVPTIQSVCENSPIPLPPELLKARAKEIITRWPHYRPLFADLTKIGPIALEMLRDWKGAA
jgi:hypothetical protein